MKLTGKKGAAEFAVAFIVVLALFIVFAKIVELNGRECSKDSDCNNDSYCGSYFQCHKFPVITQVTYIPAAMILGVCIIAGAWILRKKKEVEQGGHH